ALRPNTDCKQARGTRLSIRVGGENQRKVSDSEIGLARSGSQFLFRQFKQIAGLRSITKEGFEATCLLCRGLISEPNEYSRLQSVTQRREGACRRSIALIYAQSCHHHSSIRLCDG